jgi:hypothetical protein
MVAPPHEGQALEWGGFQEPLYLVRTLCQHKNGHLWDAFGRRKVIAGRELPQSR